MSGEATLTTNDHHETAMLARVGRPEVSVFPLDLLTMDDAVLRVWLADLVEARRLHQLAELERG